MAPRSRQDDPRRLAWRVLTAVEAGAFADAALGVALHEVTLAPRDRGLATQLVYGTLAWQGLLDHVLGQLGRAPAALDPPVRTLLRLALFQLIKLDRVPDFAAVDTAVNLAKSLKGGAASGLVNALLRRFVREGKRLALPPADERAAHFAVAASHPRWLVDRWMQELGESDAIALLQANNQAAPTVLHVNRRRKDRPAVLAALARAGVGARPTAYAPDGIVLTTAAEPTRLPGWAEGWFSVQGEASQLVVEMLGLSAGARVLDTCAAPGGKALAAAATAGVGGRVVALDRHRGGLERLRAEANRMGCALAIAQADSTNLPVRGDFDAVLVDAPCSGLGTLRQHPEIRWRRRPEGSADLARLQAGLLAAAAEQVGPQGVLLYATCTIAFAENDQVVDAFLDAHPEFAHDDPRPFLPPPAHELIDRGGALRTFPHRHGLDGFFAVRLKRSDSSLMVRP
ncbi:MAG: 16S rRNA (cytosine(967)-C(5))-methyltransferase RsmB [Candidatus Binatia bacterium]